MNCRELEKLLLDDLRAADRSAAREHLEKCPACDALRRELQALRELSGMLQTDAEAPDEFTAQVVTRVRAGSNHESNRRLTTAAAGVLVISGVLLWTAVSETGNTQEDPVEIDRALPDAAAEFDMNEPPVQLLLETPSESEYILEVPSRIKIHRQELHDEFYLTQVSH